MTRLFINSVIGFGLFTATTYAYAQTDAPKAAILCPVNETSGELRWASGEIQFPDGFEFYGPDRKRIEGSMSLRLPDRNCTSIIHISLVGSHIRGEHFDSPDYWMLSGVSESGESIRFNLEQNRQSQNFAFECQM